MSTWAGLGFCKHERLYLRRKTPTSGPCAPSTWVAVRRLRRPTRPPPKGGLPSGCVPRIERGPHPRAASPPSRLLLLAAFGAAAKERIHRPGESLCKRKLASGILMCESGKATGSSGAKLWVAPAKAVGVRRGSVGMCCCPKVNRSLNGSELMVSRFCAKT